MYILQSLYSSPSLILLQFFLNYKGSFRIHNRFPHSNRLYTKKGNYSNPPSSKLYPFENSFHSPLIPLFLIYETSSQVPILPLRHMPLVGPRQHKLLPDVIIPLHAQLLSHYISQEPHKRSLSNLSASTSRSIGTLSLLSIPFFYILGLSIPAAFLPALILPIVSEKARSCRFDLLYHMLLLLFSGSS